MPTKNRKQQSFDLTLRLITQDLSRFPKHLRHARASGEAQGFRHNYDTLLTNPQPKRRVEKGSPTIAASQRLENCFWSPCDRNPQPPTGDIDGFKENHP